MIRTGVRIISHHLIGYLMKPLRCNNQSSVDPAGTVAAKQNIILDDELRRAISDDLASMKSQGYKISVAEIIRCKLRQSYNITLTDPDHE